MSASPPPLPASFTSTLTPLDGLARVVGLDLVRGVAILGLIFINITGFSSAEMYEEFTSKPRLHTGLDAIWKFLVEFFISGKCIALLSFLLGAGLALQEQRATTSGQNFNWLTVRRMGALFLIGCLHILFLWWGDILCLYASMGLGLLLFRSLPSYLLRIVAALCISATILLSALSVAFIPATPSDAAEPVIAGEAVSSLSVDEEADELEDFDFDQMTTELISYARDIYTEGSYLQVLVVRLCEAVIVQSLCVMIAPFYFGLVLLGYDSIRSGWFPWNGFSGGKTPRWVFVLAIVGIILSGLGAFIFSIPATQPALYSAFYLASMPGSLLMAGLYLLVLMQAAQKWPTHPVLQPFFAVGRTPLSNYLLQSVLAGLIFLPYGFGLYEELGFAATMGVAATIVIVQLAWPLVWLRFFRFGPVEYLWRLMTYGSRAGLLRRIG